jgi:hypothetical protein
LRGAKGGNGGSNLVAWVGIEGRVWAKEGCKDFLVILQTMSEYEYLARL